MKILVRKTKIIRSYVGRVDDLKNYKNAMFNQEIIRLCHCNEADKILWDTISFIFYSAWHLKFYKKNSEV